MSQRTSSNIHKQQRKAQVDTQNAELEATYTTLQNILKDALSRDTYIDLDKLKTSPRIEPFKKKEPKRDNYLPSPPSGLNKMLPWKNKAYEELVFEGDRKYRRVKSEHDDAKKRHELRMAHRREQARELNNNVEDLKERFAAGHSKTVEDYFVRVLHTGGDPESFPRKSKLAYTPNSRRLTIEHDLPAFDAVPDVKAYRYVKVRDEFTQTALPRSQRKRLYASVLAQIPLRTIHAIYTADRTEKIDSIIFSGLVNTIHPGTGKPGRFCLVSVSTTRRQFLDLNLELVDPLECLKHLNGRISRKPEDLVTVDPIEVLSDTKTPPSLSRATIEEHMSRRADEVYQRVTTAESEDTSKDVPIPARTQVGRAGGSISQDGTHFVEQARKYMDRTESQAEAVPFQQYWPTYESMDAAQQHWYFYWRTELRQGNRLPTDLSYLFVHIYEVINMIGFESAQEAFDYLVEFWRYYRQLQPKLDRYLPDWIADFIILHELAPSALSWYKEVSKTSDVKDPNFAIEAWVVSGDSFDVLPDGTIFELANYNPTKSKFYKNFSESININLAYKRALIAVDETTLKEQGRSLFQIHQPEHTRAVRRAPFEGAVHAYERSVIEIAATHYWTNVEPLTAILNSIIKYADNVLREQAGYKYRARGIQLTQKYKSVIETALQPEVPKQELSIDYSEVKQLSKDSAAIRERLLADDAPESEHPKLEESSVDEQLVAAASWVPESPKVVPAPIEIVSTPPAAIAAIDWSRIGGRRKARAMLRLERFAATDAAHAANRSGQLNQRSVPIHDRVQVAVGSSGNAADNGVNAVHVPAESGFLHRPEDTPADLLTDLAEVAHIMGEGDGKRSKLIAVMMEQNWECTEETIESEFPGEFINVIIDEINSIALEEIGDTLIFEENGLWMILEEYRDETEYILQHREYLEA